MEQVSRELHAARERLAELQQAFNRELAGLPQQYGFSSARELAKAIEFASTQTPASSTQSLGRKRKRARITPELRASVISAVKSGKKGKAIALAFGISVQSVQNIKSEAGLIRPR